MNKELVSLIIPCYNEEQVLPILKEALELLRLSTDEQKEQAKDSYIKEALLLHQALSLCSSLVEESLRIEAAFMEAVRILVLRLTSTGVGGKKISLLEMNARINELLKQSIKSDGVINLFSDVKEEFSLFDPKFLEEISKMTHLDAISKLKSNKTLSDVEKAFIEAKLNAMK